MKVTLYCVGCGRAVCEAEPWAVPAISCWCGALAPVLRGDDGSFCPPSSLVSLVQMRTVLSMRPIKWRPHIEHYVGYSDHESVIKSQLIQALRVIGSISQAECSNERCQRDYKQGRDRWQQYQEGREEQERDYRILEVGEP